MKKFVLVLIFIAIGCKSQSSYQNVDHKTSFLSPMMTTLTNIPTATTQSGVVTGRLLTPDEHGKPYISVLYLGNVIRSSNNLSSLPLISFSEQYSLKGNQDPQTGQFYFSNVPPGEYAIILWTPAISMPLKDPKTKQEIIFRVEPGKVIDLGTIIIP